MDKVTDIIYRGKRVFVCCLDFQKSFDSVNY